ncbi:MAG TPA: hypothetical protein ENK75_00290, partial [Saprospiraceae bacterium]|nr:hypothetical protein [Saprospiraceae bacterium]
MIFNFSLSGQNSLEVHISNSQVLKKKSNSFNYFSFNGNHDSLIVELEDSILITILPKGKSSLLNFQDYGFRLRNIDKVKKIKVSISGYVKNDVLIKDKIIALSSGSHILSENMANKNMKGKRWPVDKNAKDWVYYFDLDQEKYDSISSTQFGASILLENTSKDTAEVVIQDVKIDVEYYSLISVCKDEIFTLYVDPPGEGYKYNWELPAGAYITSPDPNEYIINAVFTNSDFGVKGIDVSAEKSGNYLSGYGNLLYNDCRVSTLSGNIWLDNNCNDVLDTFDSSIEMLNLGLYSDDSQYLNITDSLGNFHFDSIISNYYDFKINTGDDFSLVNTGNSSFILDDDGNYNTEIFIKPGSKIDSFNFGLIQNTNLSGDVFEDMNANLVKDSLDTNSLPYTKLILSDSSGEIKSTFSDSLGKFNFNYL